MKPLLAIHTDNFIAIVGIRRVGNYQSGSHVRYPA